MADDVIVPLASHRDFKEIMINDVMPPTHNRHFFGGDATSLEAVDSSDVFSLSLVDNMALFIDEMAHPLQPVRLKGMNCTVKTRITYCMSRRASGMTGTPVHPARTGSR